jgi:hypothetical protein
MCISRLTHVASGTPNAHGRITTSDVASSSAACQDVRLVLRYGLACPDKAENFGAYELVMGKVAVNFGL